MFLRYLALGSIRLYQRYLSPYKGFCCAYRKHTGRHSCSALGYRAIRKEGIWTGIGILKKRLYLCGVAHRRFSPPIQRISGPMKYQRGECDPSFDCGDACNLNCDFLDNRGCSYIGLLADGCNGASCDFYSRGQKPTPRNERFVRIPRKRAKKR